MSKRRGYRVEAASTEPLSTVHLEHRARVQPAEWLARGYTVGTSALVFQPSLVSS